MDHQDVSASHLSQSVEFPLFLPINTDTKFLDINLFNNDLPSQHLPIIYIHRKLDRFECISEYAHQAESPRRHAGLVVGTGFSTTMHMFNGITAISAASFFLTSSMRRDPTCSFGTMTESWSSPSRTSSHAADTSENDTPILISSWKLNQSV